jgi:outer membrane receptor protein involved in Fe transport
VNVDATTPAHFSMEEAVLNVGDEIVITAERPPVQKDNTASRVFIEKAEILSRPTTALAEVMTTLPSINVEDGVMKVRGGTMNEVAFIVDGTRARNPMNQDPYTNINLGSVQDVEVLTGTFNAEYGEARSGVFNIITKEGGDRYTIYADARFTPPGIKHWGPSIYDRSTPVYWENTHARHAEWWAQYPDQWVDPSGYRGNDPRCTWSPDQAYANYLETHRPLSDYEKTAGYSGELSLTGPLPGVEGMFFSLSGKYQSVAPLMGNSSRSTGTFFDGTAKFTYRLDANTKLMLTGFLGTERSSWGIGGGVDGFYIRNYGLTARYAYYDYAGYPEDQTDGQTLKLSHILSQNSMLEVKVSRVFASRKVWTLPGDPVGWTELSEPAHDYLRAGVVGGDANTIGFHTIGYQYRFDNQNTNWTLSGYYQNQLTKSWEIKTGLEFEYNTLRQFNQALYPARTDNGIYHPYQGAGYAQSKLEFSGFIMNLGLRYDYYNPNDNVYLDQFDPLPGRTTSTSVFSQLSPRLGISHPIDEVTVLHFSYGQFFQRGSFGDYGEGTEGAAGSLTTFVIDGANYPWDLGNRNLKPEKTVAYEVGIERSFFDSYLLTVTGYYKDIRNTIRTIIIESEKGVYRTNGNGDYADVKGFELSLVKQASRASWGATWGYVNFTTQVGINGRSGDPTKISSITGLTYSPSGDYIAHNNPRLKAGLFYQTPDDWSILGGALSRLSVSADYQVVFANNLLPQDYFLVDGVQHLRKPDQNTNLKVRKDFALFGDKLRVGLYAEVHNLFNNKWLYFPAFEYCTPEAKRRFVESGFTDVPTVDENGLPILELGRYRNLPRSIVFGATVEL